MAIVFQIKEHTPFHASSFGYRETEEMFVRTRSSLYHQAPMFPMHSNPPAGTSANRRAKYSASYPVGYHNSTGNRQDSNLPLLSATYLIAAPKSSCHCAIQSVCHHPGGRLLPANQNGPTFHHFPYKPTSSKEAVNQEASLSNSSYVCSLGGQR